MKNKKIINLTLIFVIVLTLSLLMFHSQNDQLNLLKNDFVYAFHIDSTIITVDYPHSGNGIECTSCHEPHILLGEISNTVVGTGNLCISCHNPVGRGGDRPFSNADRARPGIIGTSHAWEVPIVNPNYGAALPVTEAMLQHVKNDSLICTTCHDVHGQNFPPFLRMSNEGDAMCKDCHRVRAIGSYRDDINNKGSHPVGISYPASDNRFHESPTNPGLLLFPPDDKVECSTCHKVHYATSGGANDGKGDGTLLNAVNDSSLCTSCHNYPGHLGHDCLDCHQPHNPNRENIFLVRDTIATPNSGDKVVRFLAETGPNSFGDGDKIYDGVCEVCHTKTKYHRNDGSILFYHQIGSNCTTCHPHYRGFQQIGGGCNVCHGFPPAANVPGGPHGYAPGYPPTFNEETSPHKIHASGDYYGLGCNRCHANFSVTHVNGKHQDVFFDDFNVNALYDTLSFTCNNLYCHSEGMEPSSVGSETWKDSASINQPYVGKRLDCEGCHGGHTKHSAGVRPFGAPDYPNGGVDTLTSNSHEAHVKHYDCSVCHNTTIKDTDYNDGWTISSRFNHVNKIIEVVADDSLGSFVYTDGHCSNINCHGGKDANWGDVISCSDCHGGDQDVDDFVINNTAAIINITEWESTGHGLQGSQYASGNNGAGLDCFACHDNNIGHGQTENPFRLYDITNEVCFTCHGDSNVITGKDVDETHFGYKHNDLSDGGYFCWDCHDPHGDENIFMVHDEVTKVSDGKYGIPSSAVGTSFLDHATGTDYALSAPPYDGICQICHTAANHYTATAGDGHNENIVCTMCHPHNKKFAPVGGDCIECHSNALGSRRAVMGEFEASSHHVTTGVTNEDCEVCHDQATHTDGYLDLFDPDGDSSYRAITFPQGAPLQFCLNCHDNDGATAFNGLTPFSDGVNVINVSMFYSSSGHGNSHQFPPLNGQGPIADPMIDSLVYLYSDSVGNPAANISCTGCHATHGSDNSPILKYANDQDNTLCSQCHPTATSSSGYYLTYFNRSISDYDSSAHRDLLCSACHDPHGSGNSAMSREVGDSLCLNCHTDKNAFRDMVVTKDYDHGSNKCSTCHNPHSTGYGPFLIGGLDASPSIFCTDAVGQELPITADPGKDLKFCVTCHPQAFPPHSHDATRCLACHGWYDDPVVGYVGGFAPIKTYIEFKVHDNGTTGGPADLGYSGLCVDCHFYGGDCGENPPPAIVNANQGQVIDGHTGKRNCLECHNSHKNSSVIKKNDIK